VIVAFIIAYLGIKPSVRAEVILTSIEIVTLLVFSFMSIVSHFSALSLYPLHFSNLQSSPSAILGAISAGLISE